MKLLPVTFTISDQLQKELDEFMLNPGFPNRMTSPKPSKRGRYAKKIEDHARKITGNH